MPAWPICVWRPTALLVSAGIASFGTAVGAAPSQDQRERKKDDQAIVVTGQRFSVAVDISPVATLDRNAIGATGATTMSELLRIIRPLTQSADGSDPIFLLNGQRTSGYPEIASLPPEAIDKMEVLPEAAALKFGYPPTRRVLNFITKRDFHQVELRGTAGTTTRAGSTSANANLNLTRLRKDSRLTLALESRHTSSLFQSERHLLPDPDILFDELGNVTARNGGEIDPALSAAAGEAVTVAPVPERESDRSSLDAYASAANQPRLFDLGPYRTLVPHNDAWKAETVLADRLGGTLSGSLNLTAERSTDEAISRPAPAVFTVPASNPFSPFGNTVLLHRYLTEVEPLHSRQTTTTLHGGGTLRGVIAGWRWDLTASADQKIVEGKSDQAIDLTAANAAIADGTNPFAPLDPALLADRLIDRGHLRTRTLGTKFVANDTSIHVPAGDVTLTGTAEAERMTANSILRGANPFDLDLGRTRTEAGASIDVPLTSKKEEVLAALGDLSINGSAFLRRISGFGALHDTTVGLSWSPFTGVQLLLQDKRSGTAPDMEKLASPIITVPNYPVFDYATGRTEIVTLTTGGNPSLDAERKHVRSLALNLKPFKGRDIHLTATYEDTDLRDSTGDIYALPPEFEQILPGRFVRDETGQLVAVTFQPTNFYQRTQRALNLTIAANGPVGKKPAEEDKDGARPYFYAGAGPTVRFTDRLELRPGTPALDLLHGDTVTGGGTPRLTSYFYGGIGYLGNGVSIDGWYQGSARVLTGISASDLYFSPLFKLNVGLFISVHHFLPKEGWTRHAQLRLDVSNITDAREHVRDGNGQVPNRFQADYLDPLGRIVKLTIRKLL
jgi:hypothetical protein